MGDYSLSRNNVLSIFDKMLDSPYRLHCLSMIIYKKENLTFDKKSLRVLFHAFTPIVCLSIVLISLCRTFSNFS